MSQQGSCKYSWFLLFNRFFFRSNSNGAQVGQPIHSGIGTYENLEKGTNEKRGLALIINYKFKGVYINGISLERIGSDEDVKQLKKMFQGMGYKVMIPTGKQNDLTTEV